jgi:serine/threonine protein kinase
VPSKRTHDIRRCHKASFDTLFDQFKQRTRETITFMSASSNREEEIFEAALKLPEADRAAYVDSACGGDAAFRERVMGLLKANAAVGSFMGEPAVSARKTMVVSLPPDEKPGDRIGRYKLLQQIGEGGCGVVYMAEQEEPVRRRVALKVIKLGMDTKSVMARFEAERQALAMMDHPNIAKVLDAGATETGRPFFVMELVRGIKITDYCDQNKLSTTERLGLFIQVCNAIQHAHQKGIIHRDIKPSNILVTLHDGVPVPKVIDFGIAKATQGRLTDQTLFTAFEQFIGTPAYMSPEQAEMSGLDIDTRSDIYALGVLLYELLTGAPPFDPKELLQSGLDELRRTIREKEPPKPSTRLSTMLDADLTAVAQRRQSDAPKLVHLLRGDLDWIVIKSLEKDRTRRYETANGMAMDIQRYLTNEPIVARPPSTIYRFQKLVRRNRTMFAAAGIGTSALVIGLILSLYLFVQDRMALKRAVAAEEVERQLREQAEASAEAGRQIMKAELLLMQGQYDDCEAVIAKIPPHETLVPFYNAFGSVHARRGQWREALTNWELVVNYAPADYIGYQYLPPLLLQLNDVAGYKACRSQVFREFGNTTHPLIAQRMIMASLVLPATDDEMKFVAKMKDVVANDDTNNDVYAYNLIAEGFAEYRLGNYKSALDFLRMATPMDIGPNWRTEAYFILAMARYKLNRLDDSKESFAKAVNDLNTKMRPEGHLDDEWNHWIAAHILMREAATMIGAQASELDNNAPDAPAAIQQIPDWQKALADAGYKFTVEQQADGTWQLNLNKQNITNLAILRGASISGLWLEDTPVSDLGPLRGMPLTYLEMGKTRVADLSPLSGMKLQNLQMSRTAVANLGPLRGMPLGELSLMGCTNVTDLTPLRGAPIHWLSLENAPVSDLEPLREIPLQNLDIVSTRVVDLSPLAGTKLQHLSIAHTHVADIAPIRGMPLLDLSITARTNITDVGALEGMATLKSVILPRTATNFEFLRNDTNLERISFRFQRSKGPAQTAAEFWAAQDQSALAKP